MPGHLATPVGVIQSWKGDPVPILFPALILPASRELWQGCPRQLPCVMEMGGHSRHPTWRLGRAPHPMAGHRLCGSASTAPMPAAGLSWAVAWHPCPAQLSPTPGTLSLQGHISPGAPFPLPTPGSWVPLPHGGPGRVQGTEYGVQVVGCRMQSAGYGVQGAGCRVRGTGCGEQGVGYEVQGAGCRAQGVGYGVQGAGWGVRGAVYGVQGVG